MRTYTLALGAWLCLCSAGTLPVIANQQSSLSYPDLYRSLKLPELPGAVLVSTGRKTSSLRDGVRLRLTSSQAVAQVGDFYRKALLAQGWQEQRSLAADASNTRGALLTFTKDRLTYGVTIMAAPTGTKTQVMINVVER